VMQVTGRLVGGGEVRFRVLKCRRFQFQPGKVGLGQPTEASHRS
jgi:hypothetical protein